jgi:hypothetical protein
MKLCLPVLMGVLFNFGSICRPYAQAAFSDSAVYAASVSSMHHLYYQLAKENLQIYRGSQYIRYGLKTEGFPFFESNDMLSGSLIYQGAFYPDVKLYYDLVSDNLIINDYSDNAQINLPEIKTDAFRIGRFSFVRLNADKEKGKLRGSGFYEILFTSGDIGVYDKIEKKLNFSSKDEAPAYIEYNFYFVKLNDSFYPINDESSLLDLFRDKKGQIKKFIKENKIRFKKDRQSAIVKTTAYYSQLKH